MARAEEDQMMVMGLNNYAQLALPTAKALSFFMPQLSKEMTKLAWNCVAIGQHHVIGVEQSGQVSYYTTYSYYCIIFEINICNMYNLLISYSSGLRPGKEGIWPTWSRRGAG